MMQRDLKDDWNPGTWVFIWEYSARPIQLVLIWPGLDVFQKCLCPCVLEGCSLSIGRVKSDWNLAKWVLIWDYSARVIQCIPTWQSLDGFWKSLRPCALDVCSLSIGRAKWLLFLLHLTALPFRNSTAEATFVQSTRTQRFLKTT